MKNMISCKEYVEIQKQQLKEKVSTFKRKPRLCVVQIGNDHASSVYVRNKQKVCKEIGIDFEHIHIEDYENLSQLELEVKLELLNVSVPKNDGIILQLPIPDKYDVERLQNKIYPSKDVDGFRKDSLFEPCTPKGIMDWLKFNNYYFKGKIITVVGRSDIVGRPLVNRMIKEGATVICCNSYTKTLSRFIYNADIVVSAIGKPKYFNKFDFNGVGIVVDVGINRDENGKLCGDVDSNGFETFIPNTYVTPVPGGVGLLTVISLMKNVVEAYELQNNL